MHRKILGDKGSHAVAKQRYGQVGESLGKEIMDDERICDQQLPAVLCREKSRCVPMIAVTAMVVYCNDEASTGSRFGKSRIAIAVLAEAMNDLDDASCLLSRRPELNMNLMPVFGIQRQAFVLRTIHVPTTIAFIAPVSQYFASIICRPHVSNLLVMLSHKHLILQLA